MRPSWQLTSQGLAAFHATSSTDYCEVRLALPTQGQRRHAQVHGPCSAAWDRGAGGSQVLGCPSLMTTERNHIPEPHSTHAHTILDPPPKPAAAHTRSRNLISCTAGGQARVDRHLSTRRHQGHGLGARAHTSHAAASRHSQLLQSLPRSLPPRLPHLVPPAGDRAELAPSSRAPQTRTRRKELAPRPTVSPGWSCAAPSSLTPLRRVPYVEPRSRR